jgi:hypothetical protein
VTATCLVTLAVVSTHLITRQKALTSDGLAALGSPLIRKLCQLVIIERGLRITRVQPRNQQDDIYTLTQGLWRSRPGLVRIVYRPLDNEDVSSLAEVVRSEALGEAVLIEGALGDRKLPVDPAVQVVRAAELVGHIRASALIEWQDGQPHPAQGRFELAKDLNHLAAALDPVGLRWLPTLALNQVPHDLEGAGGADELLEKIAFRILTTALRFDGRRLGTRRRGQPVPDSVLRWKSYAALLDCKAAQYGYRMNMDDQRALVEYYGALEEVEKNAGLALKYIILLSSDFAGEPGKEHPYHQRATRIKNECGATLVYLKASDLVRLVIEIESDEAEPAERQGIDWAELFDQGMPDSADVMAIWKG